MSKKVDTPWSIYRVFTVGQLILYLSYRNHLIDLHDLLGVLLDEVELQGGEGVSERATKGVVLVGLHLNAGKQVEQNVVE